jgi:SAM-dependent methyltransferase
VIQAGVHPCAACGAVGMRVFYDAGAVPVHSCRLVSTITEAEAFPTAPLRLGFCAACGFVSNVDFRPELQDYSLSYEETQAFSPRFRSFAHDLAVRWIERYDLRGKTVLELGSGKGEFLTLICELGDNRGIGIDPGLVPQRTGDGAGITWIKDLFSERYAGLSGDAVVCRHTLEHIGSVAHFLGLARAAVRPGGVALFELPDVRRVLQEGAFWDVYYEHVSYFSAGSLARLFRRAGFEVLDVALDYDDQYLVIEARPGAGGRPFELEDDPHELAREVDHFVGLADERLARWRGALRSARRPVVWGSGSKGVAFLTAIRDAPVDVVVDINPHKHGMYMAGTGQRIVPPEELRRYRPDLVIAMNPIYLEEITSKLQELGVETELRAV